MSDYELDTPVELIPKFSHYGVAYALKDNGIRTFKDVMSCSPRQIIKCKGIGRHTKMVIEEFQYDYRNLFNELLGKINPSDISGINWEQRRYEIAKTMMHAIYLDDGNSERADKSGLGFEYKDFQGSAKEAVRFADALIAELKKGGANE